MSARRTLKQQNRELAEKNRMAHLKESENISVYQRFVTHMLENYRAKVLPFQGKNSQNLPAYIISNLDGRAIAFADILFQPVDEYIKIPAGRFRNGAFVSEVFGVIKDKNLSDCSSMRYSIFLLHKEDIYSFSYKKRTKPYPTLPESEGELNVVLHRRDFNPI